MTRYFLPRNAAPEAVDLEASDRTQLARFIPEGGGVRAELVSFDFTRFMQRVRNERHTRHMRRKTIDGLLRNVMKIDRGDWVEVDQARYEAMHDRLMEKAKWMQSRKKRRFIISESSEDDDKPRLP
ncbi:MAG: hypothetical protein QM740_16730 [Acidovorax sp.]